MHFLFFDQSIYFDGSFSSTCYYEPVAKCVLFLFGATRNLKIILMFGVITETQKNLFYSQILMSSQG